jgi:hypothetical protein
MLFSSAGDDIYVLGIGHHNKALLSRSVAESVYSATLAFNFHLAHTRRLHPETSSALHNMYLKTQPRLSARHKPQ